MMNTRRWIASAGIALAGLTVFLASALLSHSSVAVAAAPPAVLTSTPASAFRMFPRSALADPDLIVESITFSPTNPDVGESVDITVTVKNQGNATASGFPVHLYVDPPDEPPNSTTAYTSRTYWGIPLPPGGSFHWVRTGHTFASAGLYPVYAWVDRDDGVTESNETNNLTGPVHICVGTECCEPDAHEDDDLCSQANWIATDGTEQQHNLCTAPDKDWVKFSAVSGVAYLVQAVADGEDADLVAELYSTCSGPPSFGSGSSFKFTAPSNGTYYAKIEHVMEDNYGPDTAYRLRVTAQNTCNAYHEPNNLCTTASDITVNGTAQMHSLCERGDADWTVFHAQAGATYVISATNVGPNADVQLGLHLNCSGPPAFGGGQRIEYTAQANGMIYVKTENLDPNVFGIGTDYRLQVVRTGECTPDAHEDDDTATAAKPLTVGGAARTHNVCPAGEADWASFAATAGLTYTIETSNLGPAADTRLCLYDATGTTQLACDDDSGSGNGSRIVWQAPAGGTYTLRVTDYDPEAAGPDTRYDLRVFEGSCTPDALEIDDTRDRARPVTPDGSKQAHNTCPAGDVDWITFAVSPGAYVIETTDLGPEADTFIELYDASETRLAFNDDYGPGTGSRIHYTFSTNGSYYVKVRHYNPTTYGTGTDYSLRIMPPGTCVPDSLEPDNSRATARSINADGSSQAHNVCPAGDVDWSTFTANAGAYAIKTLDLGPKADTLIELYDASGQLLASNDDYGAGPSSLITYTLSSGGDYYVKVRHANPTRYGAGTEYSLSVRRGSTSPPPPPPPSRVRTIILINRGRVAALHGETAATQLMNKLDALAAHSDVQGEIIRLDQNDTVSAAYAAWTLDLNSVDKANQVAAAVRGVVMTYLQEHDSVEYILLVGDDRLLPFRRIPDNTPRSDYLERDYAHVDSDHPTGAALRANYFLTDDYYADREPSSFDGRELYIPDLAVGRLIETPDEIIDFIDAFLADSQVTLGKVLVTGYDFVQDTANGNCTDWRADLGTANVDCTLIGSSWTLGEYHARQLSADPPYKVQSINGHANHYREGTPGWGQDIDAGEIASAPSNLQRGLIYTLGCHSGLNVPSDNSVGPLDLAQAFARKRANYVGNTGYGWGLRGAIGLSEKLMRLYTDELRRDESARMGQALAAAKRRYYQEHQDFTGYDEKILEESVFYGLPMARLNTGTAFGPTDPFPSVDVVSSLPQDAFGDDGVLSGTVDIRLVGALGPGDVMSRTVTNDGVYYLLDDHIHAVPGQAAQPLLYADVTATGQAARAVVFQAGDYETLSDFDPVVVSPVNDYLTQTAEAAFDELGWSPPVPAGLQTQGGETSLVIQMGQYDPISQQERLYSTMELDLYYSLNADRAAPRVTVVDSLHNHATGQVSVKVGATDPSGVRRVVATYTRGDAGWDSVELSFDASLHKWTGSFPGDTNSRYFVQVVDGAGNVAQVANKGLYFVPAVDPMPTSAVYLPVVLRQ
jgi:hypothetical protein